MSLIVIVDDQPINQEIFARLAAAIEVGAQVRTFADPVQALRWLESNTPDLIVTDYRMPSMNGASFVRRVREMELLVDVPVIVITVFDEREFRYRALDAGATDFLQSPIDHREFLTRARNLLKLRKQQLELADRAIRLEQSLKEAIRDSSERLAQVIDAVPAMISASDREGKLLFMNAYQADLLGLDPDSLDGPGIVGSLDRDDALRSEALDQLVLSRGERVHSSELKVTDSHGKQRIFLATKAPLKNQGGSTFGVVTSAVEITEQKQAEEHLRHMAHHDALTGLPNRAFLCDRLRREVVRSRRGDRQFALHLIDLDGFKDVNDLLGHSVGDRLLRALAERLRGLEDDNHFVARLGGDEFAVLQLGFAKTEAVDELAQSIGTLVSAPCAVDGETVTTTASIGIAVYPIDGGDEEDLLRHADLAMYQAKNAGGKQHRLYAADMTLRAQRAASLDAELRIAVDREQFVLHYQPQICFETMQVTGVEALLRWQHPDGTLVSPQGFLPRAEENGLIVPINEWVIREACRQATQWRADGLPPMRMAVNLSPVQFQRQTLPYFVARALADSGLDPQLLDLELTETIVLSDADAVAVQLQHLRELGVLVSIDDFGTGFSSLSYIKRFPVDRLKIDQFFIRDLETDPSDCAIVRAIISLAHTLGLRVVAEGVETRDHLARLKEEGCDEGQGYLFAKPMPAEELPVFLNDRAKALLPREVGYA